jgi:hypothetical protein
MNEGNTMNRTDTPNTGLTAVRFAAPVPTDAGIDWEDVAHTAPRLMPMNLQPAATLPMMRRQATDFNTAWGVTMPAHLDTTPQAAPYHEAIRGLVTREVNEPALFKHFFG